MDRVNDEFQVAFQRFDQWLTQQLLPKWVKLGFADNGAALERFSEDGQPDWQADKRLRVQARQLFTLCYSYQNGIIDEGRALAEGVNRFINAACSDSLPGYYPMSLDASDQVKNAHSDLYDIAFFFLAFAWQKSALNDDSALEKARVLALHINDVLASEHGGWLEGTYVHTLRRQNPHMHLFEAFIALYAVSEDPFWLDMSSKTFTLFEAHFYDVQHGVLLEYFTTDWRPCPEMGAVVEPGHMMEWVWLLNQYQRYSGISTEHYQRNLYANARRMGLPAGNRWLVDTVTPQGIVVSETFKSWPMTEWIKAALVTMEGSDDPRQHLADVTFAINQLIDGFSHPHLPAHYMYVIAANGSPVEAMMPASTLYHLCMAHQELQRFRETSQNSLY